ncbi:uncharacterized protein B0H18DRAFT_971367, partial [Fomitopsis serialis]|uniref:uncharacterized protein n=1 Tax=Fomitopsis serialis TaxID=139415 RepID=UPI002007BB0E
TTFTTVIEDMFDSRRLPFRVQHRASAGRSCERDDVIDAMSALTRRCRRRHSPCPLHTWTSVLDSKWAYRLKLNRMRGVRSCGWKYMHTPDGERG